MPKHSARSLSLTSQESYSAVIIADLVAEVQVPEQIEPGATTTKSTKEETNLGYDSHMDGTSSPATVIPDAKEVVILLSMKSNGSSISKGVILNAVQFGQDSKAKGDEKSIQSNNALSVQVLTQPSSEPSGFKDMSIPRKIAFGFSFLPSIMFVLCFAIFLPCNLPKPCVETMWIQKLNNTEATSSLGINQNVVFTILEEDINYFMTLDEKKGSIIYKQKIPAKATYLYCGKIKNKSQKDCITMDETGKIYVFNVTKGEFLWEPAIDEKHSQPITLPDCNGESEAVAVAVSKNLVKVLFKANSVYGFDIQGCDSVPNRLIPWTRNDSTDIIVTCKKDGKDLIQKIPPDIWCFSYKRSPGIIWRLHPKISSKGYILHPTEAGLVLWSGDDVSMLLADGSEEWKMTNDSHSDKNRFILYGNFIGKQKQVALLSSDISSKLQISILNSTDGSIIQSHSINASEATDVIQIQGKERDFALILLNTISNHVVTQTLEHINAISTTVINYLSNEDVAGSSLLFAKEKKQDIAFLDLDGTIHSIQNLENAYSEVEMTAVQGKDLLAIYLLRSSEESLFPNITEVRYIEVANWDISASKAPECSLK